MRKPFAEIMQPMDQVAKNNRAWYTREAKVEDLGVTFGLSAEQRRREEERDQDMALMRTLIDLLTNHIMAGSEKVNVVGTPNRYEDQDIDLDEEAKYLGNQGGFQNYNSGNQGYNSGNAGRNYSREGDRASGSSSGSKLEDMLAKVLHKDESTDAWVKEMKGDLSGMSQLVDSYTTSIKQIEQQLGKLSTLLNQRKNGSLPSDTIQNPKKDEHCMAIATTSEAFEEGDMGATIEERLAVETLAAVLMNFEAGYQTDYMETVNALQGM
uniref:Integrase core domain containing protein n=1 Tax=Solanum tuberosum TaxID=4113 RepID=M1DM53_SOLTU